MNPALKQRLVGAMVLVALGVIFLPAVFNGGRQHQEEVLMEIPPPPEVKPMVFQEPARQADTEPDKQTKQPEQLFILEPSQSQGVEEGVSKVSATKPGLDSKGLPNAWVLQVASFSDDKNAEILKQKLQKKNYKAFVRTIKKNNKTLARVMVGPEMDAKKLAVIKEAVDRQFKVKSIVVKFEA